MLLNEVMNIVQLKANQILTLLYARPRTWNPNARNPGLISQLVHQGQATPEEAFDLSGVK